MDTLWPRANDQLFRGGGYRSLAAAVLPKDIRLVAVGYKDAADALVLWLAEHGRNDALVFPIIFCYRQYLELQIKAITTLVGTFDGTDDEFKRIHDLRKLWSALSPRLEPEVDEQDRGAFSTVEDCILQFHDFDATGTGFRYPSPAGLHQIDLGNLKAVMNRVSTFLGALADQWEAGLGNKF